MHIVHHDREATWRANSRRREDAEYMLVMARTLAALARSGEQERRPMLPDLGEVIDLLDGGPRGDGVFGWRKLPREVGRLPPE